MRLGKNRVIREADMFFVEQQQAHFKMILRALRDCLQDGYLVEDCPLMIDGAALTLERPDVIIENRHHTGKVNEEQGPLADAALVQKILSSKDLSTAELAGLDVQKIRSIRYSIFRECMGEIGATASQVAIEAIQHMRGRNEWDFPGYLKFRFWIKIDLLRLRLAGECYRFRIGDAEKRVSEAFAHMLAVTAELHASQRTA